MLLLIQIVAILVLAIDGLFLYHRLGWKMTVFDKMTAPQQRHMQRVQLEAALVFSTIVARWLL